MKRTDLFIESMRTEGISLEKTESGYKIQAQPDGGKLILSGRPTQLGGVDWTGMTHLVVEATGLDNFDQAFTICFMSPQATEGPMCIINAGILPKVRTESLLSAKISLLLDPIHSHMLY